MICHNLNYELNLTRRELLSPQINEIVNVKNFDRCISYSVETKKAVKGVVYPLSMYKDILKKQNQNFNDKLIDNKYNYTTNQYVPNSNRCFSCSKKPEKLLVNVCKINTFIKNKKKKNVIKESTTEDVFCVHSKYLKNNLYSIYFRF